MLLSKIKSPYLFISIFILIILSLYLNNNVSRKFELPFLITRSNQDLKKNEDIKINMSFDDFCDTNGEWEPLTDLNNSYHKTKIFFKRTGSFYFIDGSFFRLHFLTSGQPVSFHLYLDVKLNDELILTQHKINPTKIFSPWTVRRYSFNYLDAKFDLVNLLVQKNIPLLDNLDKFLKINKINIQIKLVEINSKLTNMINKLNVKTKLLISDFNLKNSSMICAKCFYLNKPNNVLATEWWIKINKMIGYEKISFCNQSIKRDIGFEELFKRYGDFLELTTLRCIPILDGESDKRKYYHSYNQLVDYTGEFDVYKLDIINQLYINECYLNNFDKFKYIAVMDNDETVIPKMTEFIDLKGVVNFVNTITKNKKINIDQIDQIKCNRYNKSLKNLLESYISEVSPINDIPKTYYFGQGYFVKNNFVIKMMDALELFFTNSMSNQIRIIDSPFNYTFLIRDNSEIEYAKSLLKLNKYIIQPYYKKYNNIIQNYTHNFDRFFFITGHINDFSWGKSIHDSRYTFDLTVHHAITYIDQTKREIYRDDYKFLRTSADAYLAVPYELGYESHFRDFVNANYKPISIKYLNFDINYFNCYFRPILTELSTK